MARRRYHGRKKIDQWTFPVHGRNITVDVLMAPGPPTEFLIDEEDVLGTELRDSDPDIDDLYLRVAKEVQSRTTFTLVWSDKLYIEVSSNQDDLPKTRGKQVIRESRRSYLAIEVTALQIAVDAGGRKVQRGRYSGTNVKEDWPEEGPFNEGHRGPGEMHAGMACLVDDTPTNRACLNKICTALTGLRLELGALFSPEHAQHTLNRMSQGKGFSLPILHAPSVPPVPPVPPKPKKARKR